MPCERPRRARSSSRVTASSATASRPASSTWNSSITATIRGQCPPGSSARSSDSLAASYRLAAWARVRSSSLRCRSMARPNSRSPLTLMPASRTCGQPAGVARPGHEPGERHALLEVEQVEGQFVGAVTGGERGQPGVDQVGLAGAGRAADQRVRRVVAERHLDQRAVGAVADRRDQAVRRRLRPELRRLQVGQPGRRRAGPQPLGGGPAERRDPVGRRRRVEPDLQVAGEIAGRRLVAARRGGARSGASTRSRPRTTRCTPQATPGPGDPVELRPLRARSARRRWPGRRAGRRPATAPGAGPGVAAVRSASDAYSPASTVSLTRQMCSTSSSSMAPRPPGPTNEMPSGANGASVPPRCSGS